MNLKLIDAAIAAYSEGADEKDVARLKFFRMIWGVQEKIAEELDGSWTAPGTAEVAELAGSSTPLLQAAPACVEPAKLADATARIIDIIKDQGALPEDDGEDLAGLDWVSIIELSDSSLAGSAPARFLESVADTLATKGAGEETARIGALAVSLALKPFLESAAKGGMRALKDASSDDRHPLTCPVCGTAPSVGRVGGSTANGRHRSLWCPQCGAEWAFDRVRCARCGTRNQGSIHFHNIEGDDAHRIASCDECGGYLRVVYVDEEKLLAPFSFEVEDVVMARLDAIAADPSFAGTSSKDTGK